MADAISYMAIPWRRGGRSFSGCDCWGLVQIWYSQEMGINLPEHPEDEARPLFRKLSSEEDMAEGDVIVMDEGGPVPHVGVWTGGALLHQTHGGVQHVPLKRLPRALRVMEVDRYVG